MIVFFVTIFSMNPTNYDLAIIGGGPAGAAAAVYAARKRLKTILITKDWLGQSNVSEKIENWVGTVAISGFDLSESLKKHAKAYADGIIDFKEGELATEIKKGTNPPLEKGVAAGRGIFEVISTQGTYQAKTVLIVSGSGRRKLDVPGADLFEHKGLTYCATCDGPLYDGQDVVVIGGGNAGFESAAQLLAYCKSVTLLARSDFKADPGTVEKVLSNPKMKAYTYAIPKEVKGDKFVTSLTYTDAKTNTDIEIKTTGIFVEIGSIPNSDFAKNTVTLDTYNHIITNPKNQQTSTRGIWAAGDVTDGLYHQNNIAAGDAVKAIEDIYFFLNA